IEPGVLALTYSEAPQAAGGVVLVDSPAAAAAAGIDGYSNQSITPPSANVKPISSPRRLTSLTIRNYVGYSNDEDDDDDSAKDKKRNQPVVHLKSDDGDNDKAEHQQQRQQQRQQQQQHCPTPGSTQSAGKVPDIRTIVDLATGRAGLRVSAAKVGPSPSGSACSGGSSSFSSRGGDKHPCSTTTPSGPHPTPVRPLRLDKALPPPPPLPHAPKAPRRAPPPPPPVSPLSRPPHLIPRDAGGPCGHAPRASVATVAEMLAKADAAEAVMLANDGAAAATAAEAEAEVARAKPTGGKSTTPSSGRMRRPPPSRPPQRERQQRRGHHHEDQRRDGSDPARSGRPVVVNPYRVAAKSGSSRAVDARHRQRKGGGRQRRRAKKDGMLEGAGGGCRSGANFRGCRRGEQQKQQHQAGGSSIVESSPTTSRSSWAVSSPSAASSGSVYTVDWIWPAKGPQKQPPRLVCRYDDGTDDDVLAYPTPIGKMDRLPAFRSPSSSSPPLPFPPRPFFVSSATSPGSGREGWRGAGHRAGSGGGGGGGAQECDDGADLSRRGECGVCRSPACGHAAWAAALEAAQASAQRAAASRSSAGEPAGTTAGGGGTAATPGNCGVPLFGAFRPDGHGGWIGSLLPSPPPAPAGPPSAPAPSCASNFGGGGGEQAVADDEDLDDLAPLPPPLPVRSARQKSARRAAGDVAVGRSSGVGGGGSGGDGNDAGDHHHAEVATVAQAGGWWRVFRSWFEGPQADGESPVPPSTAAAAAPTPAAATTMMMTQEDTISDFLNPFSPASYRRFSASLADAGAPSDGYVSGDGFFGGGGGRDASGTRRSPEMAKLNLEERVMGCVFGGSDSPDVMTWQRGREIYGGRRQEDGRGEVKESEPPPACFTVRQHPPPPRPLPDNAWRVPAGVEDASGSPAAPDGGTADGPSKPFGTAATCSAGMARARAFRSSPSLRPPGTPRSSPRRVTAAARSAWLARSASDTCAAVDRVTARAWLARSASDCAAAVARANANAAAYADAADAAATAAALAEQASVAARAAAETAIEARDALVFSDSINAVARA
ncbi:unnamed protein product, partial [Ectocarpus sp. 8 AP-2014]